MLGREERLAEILDENGGPAGRLAVSDAVLEADEAVLGFLAIEAAAFVVDVPDAAVGGREDAPGLARDVRVERGEALAFSIHNKQLMRP